LINLPEVGTGKGFLAVFTAAKLSTRKGLFCLWQLVGSPQTASNLNKKQNQKKAFLHLMLEDEVVGLGFFFF
jgi:hypothetical protein